MDILCAGWKIGRSDRFEPVKTVRLADCQTGSFYRLESFVGHIAKSGVLTVLNLFKRSVWQVAILALLKSFKIS